MKKKWIQTKDYFIGNLGDSELTDKILSSFPDADDDMGFREGTVAYEEKPDHEIRNCLVAGLDVGNGNFVESGLRRIITNVNSLIWNLDIKEEWDGNIQYTKYAGKGKHHYDWHCDNYEPGSTDRILTIVYCLSKESDYSGGEFEIETSEDPGSFESVHSQKFDYGDFIVFPSSTYHRVIPLIDGVRIVMVGWML